MADHAVTRPTFRDAPELLDVDVHELAGVAALVAIGRLRCLQARSFAKPIRFNHSDTVESESDSTSAISAAVIRSLRSEPIAWTFAGGNCRGERSGREERSSKPSAPSWRQRSSQR
jgi:hypothetical protein